MVIVVMTASKRDAATGNAWIYKSLAILGRFSIETAMAYAVAFTLIGGTYLLNLQDSLCQLLCTELQTTGQQYGLRLRVSTAGAGRAGNARTENFLKKPTFFEPFTLLKNLFCEYEAISGWYLLALLVAGVTVLIQGICYTVFGLATSIETQGNLVGPLWLILLSAFFGEFFRHEVSCTC